MVGGYATGGFGGGTSTGAVSPPSAGSVIGAVGAAVVVASNIVAKAAKS